MGYRNRERIDAGDYLNFLLEYKLDDSDRELLDLFCDLYGYNKEHDTILDYIKYLKNNVTLVELEIDSTTFIDKCFNRIFDLGMNRYLDDLNSSIGYFGSKGFRVCIDKYYGDYFISPEDFLEIIVNAYEPIRTRFDDDIYAIDVRDKVAYVLSQTVHLQDLDISTLAYYYWSLVADYMKSSYDRSNIQDLITITTDQWSYLTKAYDTVFPERAIGNNCCYVFDLLEELHLTKDEVNEFNYKIINKGLGRTVQSAMSKNNVFLSTSDSLELYSLFSKDKDIRGDINRLSGKEVM